MYREVSNQNLERGRCINAQKHCASSEFISCSWRNNQIRQRECECPLYPESIKRAINVYGIIIAMTWLSFEVKSGAYSMPKASREW